MLARIGKWWGLPPAQRRQFLLMLVALPLVSLSLRLFGYTRCRRWIESMSTCAAHSATEQELRSAEVIAQLAEKAGRTGFYAATCLRQSLLVYGWLRRWGLAPELRLGVRKGIEDFAAHAWIELEGRVLAQPDPSFTPLTTLPVEKAVALR